MLATLAFLTIVMAAFSTDFRGILESIAIVMQIIFKRTFTVRNFIILLVFFGISFYALKAFFSAIGLAWVIILLCLPISIVSLWRKKKLGMMAMWLIAISIGTLILSPILGPILDGLAPAKNTVIREISDWAKETDKQSLAKKLQGIESTGLHARTKRAATMLFEDGSSISLPKFTEILVTLEKTRQQPDSETEVWISLKNENGDFIGGKTGWLPASVLTYTNVNNISSNPTVSTPPAHSTTGTAELRNGGEFEINFIPDSYDEVNLGWKKTELPPGEYCVNSMSGWFKQALFDENNTIVYYDIPSEGRNFLNFIPHCPISGKKFGVPILKIGGLTIPLQQGTCFSVAKEAYVSANIPTDWSDVGTNYQLWFSENKGPGFKITLSSR